MPAAVGLVALDVDGKAVVPVQRRGDEITLGRGAGAAPEADNLEVHVYRKLADGMPAMLTTEIRIAVSGQAREEVLGPVLPAGFAPLTLTGEWPARIDGDGTLHVQVTPAARPSRSKRARRRRSRKSSRACPKRRGRSRKSGATKRPRRCASRPRRVRCRSTRARPTRPDEWQTLPAFALGDGATLAIDERSRGLAADEKNRLTLDREMWLDFAGDGWFAQDRIGGAMLRGWRFEVAPPFALERADALKSENLGQHWRAAARHARQHARRD